MAGESYQNLSGCGGVQAQMLGEAVRQLAVLLALGSRVYVHCTAGINRANLVVVAYLTNVEVRPYASRHQTRKRELSCAHGSGTATLNK